MMSLTLLRTPMVLVRQSSSKSSMMLVSKHGLLLHVDMVMVRLFIRVNILCVL